MAVQLAANLSWLFTEAGPLPARYAAAAGAGFTAVEVGFPYDTPLSDLVAAKEASGLQQVLINAPPGDISKGETGLAALPNREKDFKESIELAIKYAKALKCNKVHVMSGKEPSKWTDSAMDDVYIENITYAAQRLSEEGILCLIEPVNSHISVPHYYMNHPEKALKVMQKINHPNLKLQLDLFHLQIVEGNLTSNIKKYLPYTGHMQIAQVPDRHEPDSAGEIQYSYVFSVLRDAGYSGHVGLEYKPKDMTQLRFVISFGEDNLRHLNNHDLPETLLMD